MQYWRLVCRRIECGNGEGIATAISLILFLLEAGHIYPLCPPVTFLHSLWLSPLFWLLDLLCLRPHSLFLPRARGFVVEDGVHDAMCPASHPFLGSPLEMRKEGIWMYVHTRLISERTNGVGTCVIRSVGRSSLNSIRHSSSELARLEEAQQAPLILLHPSLHFIYLYTPSAHLEQTPPHTHHSSEQTKRVGLLPCLNPTKPI